MKKRSMRMLYSRNYQALFDKMHDKLATFHIGIMIVFE